MVDDDKRHNQCCLKGVTFKLLSVSGQMSLTAPHPRREGSHQKAGVFVFFFLSILSEAPDLTAAASDGQRKIQTAFPPSH